MLKHLISALLVSFALSSAVYAEEPNPQGVEGKQGPSAPSEVKPSSIECYTSGRGCNGRARFDNNSSSKLLYLRYIYAYGGASNWVVDPGQTQWTDARYGDYYQHKYGIAPGNSDSTGWVWVCCY